jgi:hypothetical protein
VRTKLGQGESHEPNALSRQTPGGKVGQPPEESE